MAATGLGDQMYEGAAEAGKIYTTIKLVIASIIGIIFLIIGFFLIFSKNKHTQEVTAQITKINNLNDYCTGQLKETILSITVEKLYEIIVKNIGNITLQLATQKI